MKLLPNEWGVADKTVSIKKFEFNNEMEFEEDVELSADDSDQNNETGTGGWPELTEDIKIIADDSDQNNETGIGGWPELTEDIAPPKSLEEKPYKEDTLLDKAKREADEIIASANEMVEKIRQDAEKEKEQAVEAGRQEGYDAGFKEGEKVGEIHAKEAYVEMTQDTTKQFLQELKTIIESVSAQKEIFAKKYFDELCELTMTVAEKVINISLSTSGQVIERMIIAATEKSGDKQWATVHVSEFDEEVLLKGDIDLLESVKHISPKLKLTIVPDGKLGTCIIEMPDKIIDASVETQMENIKELVKEHKWNGEV